MLLVVLFTTLLLLLIYEEEGLAELFGLDITVFGLAFLRVGRSVPKFTDTYLTEIILGSAFFSSDFNVSYILLFRGT